MARDTAPGSPALPFRIGHGYDLHRLEPLATSGSSSVIGVPGRPVRPLVVGGVRLQSTVGVLAHSDGDVLYHAVVDAILGALALPDIGQLFPDNAPENDGRSSADFMRDALARCRAAGWTVANVDATVILERPRLWPVKEQIRRNVAELLGVTIELVNVKGKSHERVDAVGEGRAIEAHAVVLLQRL
jgi:2-C-methyl-D-erythritol 2,4-cyclodiphosphate synthase